MKNKLTPAQLAALAAGATMAEVLASASATGTDAPVAPPAVPVQPPADGEADKSATAQAALFAQNEQLVNLTAENAALKATNLELDTKLAVLQAQVVTAESTLTTVKAAADTMTVTILDRVKNMSIALNATAPEQCEDPVALVALHADLDAQFKKQFSTGRVSASSTKTEEPKKSIWSQTQLAAARAIPVYN